MLYLKSIVPVSSEIIRIDEFTQSVEWNYLGKPTYYYWEAGDTDMSLFQVGIHKDGRISSITLTLAENIQQSPDEPVFGHVFSDSSLEGIPVFHQSQENTGKAIRSGLKFNLILGDSQLGIVLDNFKDVKPDRYAFTEHVVFAFHDRKLIATYIIGLQEDELDAISWKYLR